MTDYKPKLIEVALPLAAINEAARLDKNDRHGHPALHQWWARRPLSAARAVIWASLVDDPSGDRSLSHKQQTAERKRLFAVLERLVSRETSSSPAVLAEAKAEIDRCFPEGPPAILDPFGGGGAIPLEAQRLGLNALASDLNPVSVLIQKAMLEIPPRFADLAPVHHDLQAARTSWEQVQGLAADIEAYGHWMLEQATQHLGPLYPNIVARDGSSLAPVAWIWARAVASPDPTWRGLVPLVGSWDLATKPGVWVEPVVSTATNDIAYRIRRGKESRPQASISDGQGRCIATGSAIPGSYIKEMGLSGNMGQHLIAVVADGPRAREYLPGDRDQERLALNCPVPENIPTGPMSSHPQYMGTPRYGIDEWWKLFTPRQLTALTTFAELLNPAWERVRNDALSREMPDDGRRLADGGFGATAYADAVQTYLALVLSKCAAYWCTSSTWNRDGKGRIRTTFSLQAIPMRWTYAEANPIANSGGSFGALLGGVVNAVKRLPAEGTSEVLQCDARERVRNCSNVVISTDPPYYDMVPFADISDFFFVWLRPALSSIWPDLFATVLTPKSDELVADAHRHGSPEGARAHFETGISEFMREVRHAQSPGIPATIYYAYKNVESDGITSWSTFLQAVIDAGLQVTATWPLRTERQSRARSIGANALASSILLVCRPAHDSAPRASRSELLAALRRELPEAVKMLQSGNIAPVDLTQATIGPGIRIFSAYSQVIESTGRPMRVSEALEVINNILGEVLDGDVADLDVDTRFAVSWWEQHCFDTGLSGDADIVARARDTSLDRLREAGIGSAREGKFWLTARSDVDLDWDPALEARLTTWKVLQQLVVALEESVSGAGGLLHRLGMQAEGARQLAYVLFQKASDNGWSEEAAAYNSLIMAWAQLLEFGEDDEGQGTLV